MIWNTFFRRPQLVLLRKALFQVHLWMGIATGLYILTICTTGAALVFRSEMQHALYPQFYPERDTAAPVAGIADVVRNMKAAYPDYPLSGVRAPNEEQQAFLGYMLKDERFRAVFADPATGKVIGSFPEESFLLWLQNLHFYRLSGTTGLFVNGLGALCLLFMCMTGLVIWWPGIESWRRSLTMKFGGNWKRITWEMHRTTGFWASALVLMWAATGIYFAFPQPFRTTVGLFAPMTVSPPVVSNAPIEPGTPTADLGSLVARAQESLPEAHVARVSLPLTERGSIQVVLSKSKPTPRDAAGDVYYYFDQFSGELLHSREVVERSTGDVVISSLALLHMGLFGGTGIKILWLILGLSPAVLFVTGVAMWWNRVINQRWTTLQNKEKEQLLDVYRG